MGNRIVIEHGGRRYEARPFMVSVSPNGVMTLAVTGDVPIRFPVNDIGAAPSCGDDKEMRE